MMDLFTHVYPHKKHRPSYFSAWQISHSGKRTQTGVYRQYVYDVKWHCSGVVSSIISIDFN